MKKLIATTLACALLATTTAQAANVTLLNVSYDPTRELYKDLNGAFGAQWKQKTGDTVTINMSHNGSGAQSRAIIDGLDADVATLALAYDIDAIASKAKLLPADWQKKLPQGSTPYTSTIVFLVRKGNPWKVKDWPDLVKPGIHVVTPNPKTSGGARWSYLAAWAYAEKAAGGNKDKAKAFVANLYKHVPVLDTGARGATTTFAQRGIGDVLLSWENEAHLALQESGGADKFQIVYPSNSILAEPPVALIDKNVDRHGTRKVAEAYLQFLYTKEAQEIEAKDFYRPRDQDVLKAHRSQFPDIPLYTIDDVFGGWTKAQQVHFSDGGVFDQIYKPGQ
jgi:sulfate transport system substrate-binding protein